MSPTSGTSAWTTPAVASARGRLSGPSGARGPLLQRFYDGSRWLCHVAIRPGVYVVTCNKEGHHARRCWRRGGAGLGTKRGRPRRWVGRNSPPPCPRLQPDSDSIVSGRSPSTSHSPPHPWFVQRRRLAPRRWSLHRHRRPSGLSVTALGWKSTSFNAWRWRRLRKHCPRLWSHWLEACARQ